jgi:hypothetical protein
MSCGCGDFRFNLDQWRRALAPITPPAGQSFTLALDSSFTAHETSDESSASVGYLGEEDGGLNVLDCVAGRWKGIHLPDEVVSLCEKWKPAELRIEHSPFFDLLHDTILLRAEMRQVNVPRITPVRVVAKKKHRIRRLQTLLDQDLLHIHKGSFVGALFNEVENFCFAKEDNHRRSDNRVDSIALLANFR